MKFFFGFLAFIAAIVVVILLIVNVFSGSSNGQEENPVTTTFDLSDPSAVGSIVRYTTAGPVVADENFRQIRVTVSRSSRTLEVLRGYGNIIDRTQTFSNSDAAYIAFLGALEAADFADLRQNISARPDTTCVTGSKYFNELTVASEKKVDSWTTSCSFNDGNFAGNITGVGGIFRNQIPNYFELTNGVNLFTF